MPIVNISVNIDKDIIEGIILNIIIELEENIYQKFSGLSDLNINKFFPVNVKKEITNQLLNNISNEKVFKEVLSREIPYQLEYVMDQQNLFAYEDFKCLKPLIDPIIKKIELAITEKEEKIIKIQKKKTEKKIKDYIKLLKDEGYEINKKVKTTTKK